MNAEILQGFFAQAEDALPAIRRGILVCVQTGNAFGELNDSLRQTIAVKDAARIVELSEAAHVAEQLEIKLAKYSAPKTSLSSDQIRELLDKLIELEAAVARANFRSEDFAFQVNDLLDASFENLIADQPAAPAEATSDDELEGFEIDEEMLEIFKEEAEELIQNIRANLERLEKNANDREALLEVRRNAHTLKGSAGIVGLKELSKVAHRVEDLLEYLAENEIDGDARIFQLLLVSTDCFSRLADNETSAALSKKIAELYKTFDTVSFEMKSAAPVQESESNAVQNERANEEKKSVSDETQSSAEAAFNHLPETANPKLIVRVSLEKLNDLVKIAGGLVVSRSVFEQRLVELEQQIGELHNSTRRLNLANAKLETDFESDMLQVGSPRPSSVFGLGTSILDAELSNPKSKIQNPKSFDSLELDRYTEFHQTLRELTETTGDTSAISTELDQLRGNLETLFENQRGLIEEMQDKLLRLRMVSFGSLAVRLQRTVRVTADEEEKLAVLHIENETLEVDTQILDAVAESLLHLLRNAVAHGIEPAETRRLLGKPEAGQITVRVSDEGTQFVLTVADDGHGISVHALKNKAVRLGFLTPDAANKMSDAEALQLIFQTGLTTSGEVNQISGRGVGMNIVKTAIERQQGSISVESEPNRGTVFIVRLPIALSVTRALLIRAETETYAIPLKFIKQINCPSINGEANDPNQKSSAELTTQTFHINKLIGLPVVESTPDTNHARISLKTADAPVDLAVDEIVKSEEIIIKPLGSPLRALPGLIGAAILGDGSIVPVLDLPALLEPRAASLETEKPELEKPASSQPTRTVCVLIVDDSPSVRRMTSKIVENAGFETMIAKDGLEALSVLQSARELPDVILSDIEMPGMNGYELLAALKKQDDLRNIPVVMITSRANEKHRQKAIDLDAAEYLTKPFDDAKLIETIKNLTS